MYKSIFLGFNDNIRLNFIFVLNLMMQKKEIDKLLKDRIFQKLVDEYKKKIKRQAKDIDKQQKDFYKFMEKIQKDRKKFEKQLAQLKK